MPDLKKAGKPLKEAKKVAIMIHGRGATATSILDLQNYLHLEDFALLAPQAPGNTWYPYSFMAPDKENEPAFSQAIQAVSELVKTANEAGFSSEQLYFFGFSQGACLALEYASQNAQKYGGVIAFTGGLIGEEINEKKYQGDFEGTPVFIGSSHKDMHVPLSRIDASAKVIERMGAKVKTMIFEDQQHTIREEEVDWVNQHILDQNQ
ncbi:alpha/beta hydrolase [Pararhodonellum marinum]|uniref:alpha/beta hydrolase n=1 Tax=Pararhodonellum marinum TaxID=2755358 RepID=UPI00188FF591|nr:dienelactone hydrolase family protein [Pararhodonellum marinum]